MELFFMCLKIFLARIFDVSIGTIRQNVLHKDYIWLGTILAFLEILIWFMIAREALVVASSSILIPISYSLGYATGSFLGTYCSRRWINGIMTIQIIAKKSNRDLVCALKLRGYRVSIISLQSDGSEKYQMIFIEVKNKSYNKIKKLVNAVDSNAFIIVSDTKKVYNGIIK